MNTTLIAAWSYFNGGQLIAGKNLVVGQPVAVVDAQGRKEGEGVVGQLVKIDDDGTIVAHLNHTPEIPHARKIGPVQANVKPGFPSYIDRDGKTQTIQVLRITETGPDGKPTHAEYALIPAGYEPDRADEAHDQELIEVMEIFDLKDEGLI